MKIAINILKAVLLVLTAIWGIVFGVFAPLSILTADIVDADISSNPIIIVWLINSIVCFVGGTVTVMLGHTKIASVISTVGFITVLAIYANFVSLYAYSDSGSNPISLYLPAIFITIVTYVIAFLSNWRLIQKKLSAENEKKEQAAPSVLGGTYTAAKADKKEKRK